MKQALVFIETMKFIQEQLNALEAHHIGLYEAYQGTEFEGQERCAAEVENLTLMLTHELSSQIAFGIQNFNELLKYIQFRQNYAQYSDEILSEIIDGSPFPSIQRRKSAVYTQLVKQWEGLFGTDSYQKMKTKLRLG